MLREKSELLKMSGSCFVFFCGFMTQGLWWRYNVNLLCSLWGNQYLKLAKLSQIYTMQLPRLAICLTITRGQCCQTKLHAEQKPFRLFISAQDGGMPQWLCECVPFSGLCRCTSGPRFLAANGNQRPAEWVAHHPRVAVHTPVAQEQNQSAGPSHVAGTDPHSKANFK